MAYTPKFGGTDFRGGKNILASEHFQFIEGGATLDAAAFGANYVEVGTLIARNTTTGKFEPYAETEGGTFEAGYDEPAILNIDVDMDGEHDAVVGEVIVRGSVYEQKLPTEVPEGFRNSNDNIRYVKHITG